MTVIPEPSRYRAPSPEASAALLAWMEVPREHAPGFDDWYSFEHLVERLDVPGFLRGTRYRAPAADDDRVRRYFTLYEVDDTTTFASEPYLARLDDPTPWTLATIAHVSTEWRIAAHLKATIGRGRSGCILVAEGRSSAPGERLREIGDALDGLLEDRLIVSGRIYARDAAAGATRHATSEGRAGVIEATREPDVVVVADLHVGADQLEASMRLAETAGVDGRVQLAELCYDLSASTA